MNWYFSKNIYLVLFPAFCVFTFFVQSRMKGIHTKSWKSSLVTQCRGKCVMYKIIKTNLSFIKTPLVLSVFLGLQEVSEKLFPLLFVVRLNIWLCLNTLNKQGTDSILIRGPVRAKFGYATRHWNSGTEAGKIMMNDMTWVEIPWAMERTLEIVTWKGLKFRPGMYITSLTGPH